MRLFAILLCVFPVLLAEQIFRKSVLLFVCWYFYFFKFSYGFGWLFVNFDVLVILFNYFLMRRKSVIGAYFSVVIIPRIWTVWVTAYCIERALSQPCYQWAILAPRVLIIKIKFQMILTKLPGCRPTFSRGGSQIISLASALEQLHHLHVRIKDVYF